MNGPGFLPFERLRLIDDPTARPAALNMALDEILLEGLGREPVLRIYRWERPAVSIGYFDPAGSVIENGAAREVVRRWTGGGVVEHGDDLTFSLLVPRFLPLAASAATESYRAIHAAVAVAFARVDGPAATLQTVAMPGPVSSRACFENPVTHDLLVSGRKVAGGAQRRTQQGLLHQGSIRAGGAVSEASVPRWLTALASALPSAFGKQIDEHRLTAAELASAESLAGRKYGTAAWLRRR